MCVLIDGGTHLDSQGGSIVSYPKRFILQLKIPMRISQLGELQLASIQIKVCKLPNQGACNWIRDLLDRSVKHREVAVLWWVVDCRTRWTL